MALLVYIVNGKVKENRVVREIRVITKGKDRGRVELTLPNGRREVVDEVVRVKGV